MMENNKLLLLPLSFLYGFFIRIRNVAFKLGFIKQRSFQNVLIVSVGNLVVGGSGKTPLVEYLIENLQDKYKVAVLSRGYGRKTRGFRMVSCEDSSAVSGDEPIQISRKFKDIPISVQEKRCKGVKNILHKFPDTQIIILDDAFQHRTILPDVNIILTDYHRPYFSDFLIPAGKLREHTRNSKRANVVIVTKCDKIMSPIVKNQLKQSLSIKTNQLFLTSYIVYSNLLHCDNTKTLDLFGNNINNAVCFSGIANNYWFEQIIKQLYNDFKILKYADHHEYSKKDLTDIVDTYKNMYGSKKIVITTEKDYMRLKNKNFEDLLSQIPLYYLPIRTAFHNNDGEKLINFIKSKLHVKVQNL